MSGFTRKAPKGSVRASNVDGRPTIELQILRYNVVDDYGWLWLPNCLNRTLGERWPQLTWAHAWDDVIGRAFDADTANADGPIVRYYLDDFDAVPRAKQAYAQVQSGTIDDCSIGFDEPMVVREPTDQERAAYPGVQVVCQEASLNETALVLRGAVPGAKVMALVRSRPGAVITEDAAAAIFVKFANGDFSLREALQAVEDAAETPQVEPATPATEEPAEKPQEPETTKPEEESTEQPAAEGTETPSSTEEPEVPVETPEEVATPEEQTEPEPVEDPDPELDGDLEEALALVGAN